MSNRTVCCPHCGAELSNAGLRMGWCHSCQQTLSPDDLGEGKMITENKQPNTMEKQSDEQTVTNVTRHIHLEKILIGDMNPRKFIDEQKLGELADSIDTHGVIQPITVRPVEDEEEPFELVSGERRYKASRKAGLDLIPAYVKPMSDEAAFEAQCIENIQREDVHPLDEAAGYRQMKDRRGMSAPEIAERMDKSVSYVTKRLKMNDLIEPLAEIFYENEDMKIGHAMEICRLPENTQEELLQLFNDPDDPTYMPTVHSLRDTISRKFLMQLDSAIFDPKDEELYPEAGPCETCPKRSSNNPTLFPDLEGADRCTDRSCFEMKEHLQLIALIEQYKDDPDYYFIRSSYNNPDDKIAQKLKDENIEVLIKYDDFGTYGVDEEQAVNGIYVAGAHDKGKIVPIELKKGDSDNHPDNMTKDERKEKLPRDEFLEYEINRIQERKDRKVELDREKVQKNIIDKLEELLVGTDVDDELKLYSDKLYYLAVSWALYEGLGFYQQKVAEYEMDIRETNPEDEDPYSTNHIPSIEVMQKLSERDEEDLELISSFLLSQWLFQNCTSSSYMDPEKNPGAFVMRKAGETLIPEEVDVFDTNQTEKRKERNARYDERLAEHRAELEELQEGEAEEEPGSSEFPPTVELLVGHVRADGVDWDRQTDVTNEVAGVPVRYSQLTEPQARQVYDYLVEQGELEPENEDG